jgi:hypothetical protein
MATLAFSVEYYRAKYGDLSHLSAKEAEAHFIEFGIREGRAGAIGGLREEFVPRAPRNLPVLELGPFANPALRGMNIRYADVLSTTELRVRAVDCGMDPAGCPEIHYVLTHFDLSRITEKFSAVFSSHCIEHQPDLVRHLQSVEMLLSDQGQYLLIIPDKRYCFDHFLPETSIADIMTAYVRNQRVHEVGSIIEHWALTTHNETERHWNGDHGQPHICNTMEPLTRALREYQADPMRYFDVHAWQFTPKSFLDLILLLNDLNLTTLSPVEVHNTPWGRNEFCAILEKRSL